MAAVVVRPDQVRKIFATDLNRGGYIVVDVAVYPEARRVVDLSNADFVLRIDSETVRPVGASAIADIFARRDTKPLQPDDVTVVKRRISGARALTILSQGGARAWFIPALVSESASRGDRLTLRQRIATDPRFRRNWRKSLYLTARRHLRLPGTYIFRDHAARPKAERRN